MEYNNESLQSIEDLLPEIKEGDTILVRVDFNVPQDEQRNVTDATRIEAAMKTLTALSQKGAKVIVISHLDRVLKEKQNLPKVERDPQYSMKPVAEKFEEIAKEHIGKDVKVTFVDDVIGDEVEMAKSQMKPGEFLVLDNLRYYSGEEKNDPKLAVELVKGVKYVVDEAFSADHRASASMVGIKNERPAYIGYNVEFEVLKLNEACAKPKQPFLIISGGAKIKDKIEILTSAINSPEVGNIFIGGAMDNAFMKAQGKSVGDFNVKDEELELANKLLSNPNSNKILFPIDLVIATSIDDPSSMKTIKREDGVPQGWAAVDMGSESIKQVNEITSAANTVVWNGPVGIYEVKEFAAGTDGIADGLSKSKAIAVVGGGNTIEATKGINVFHKSTAGGATLEYIAGLLSGKELPGIVATKESGKKFNIQKKKESITK